MKFKSWVVSDKGLKRSGNQDSYLVDEKLGLFIVADGVGGHMGGEVASALAVETVKEILLLNREKIKDNVQLLELVYSEASKRIFDRAYLDQKLTGMGTTMVMGYVQDAKIYLANVGDSRCYLFRKPNLWQLTEDHSLINEQLRLGVMSEEVIRKTIAKNVITRSVGYERDAKVDILEREICEGDVYIFCSDGLSGMVNDELICQILNQNPIDKAYNVLMKQALAHGGDDNVTVLVLNFGEA